MITEPLYRTFGLSWANYNSLIFSDSQSRKKIGRQQNHQLNGFKVTNSAFTCIFISKVPTKKRIMTQLAYPQSTLQYPVAMNSQSQDKLVLYRTKLRCRNNKLANLKPLRHFWYGSILPKYFLCWIFIQ